MTETADLQQQLSDLRAQIPNMMGRSNFALVRHASEESSFPVLLNGERFLVPRDTILSNRHTVGGMHGLMTGELSINTELEIIDYCRPRLPRGGVFVDIGAMGGVVSLPMSRAHDGDVGVVAFEPARNAIRNLDLAIRTNGVQNVELIRKAVGRGVGIVSFSEVPFGDDEDADWLTQTSSILHDATDPNADVYDVEVVSLDQVFASRADRSRVTIIKIDVEGFEVDVIDGAMKLLNDLKPALAIDIHKHPYHEGTTDTYIEDRLQGSGYVFDRQGHVLFCNPVNRK